MKSGVNVAVKVAGTDSVAFAWNDDFVLAAFFH